MQHQDLQRQSFFFFTNAAQSGLITAYLGIYVGAKQLHNTYALYRIHYLEYDEFQDNRKKYYFMLIKMKIFRLLFLGLYFAFCSLPLWYIWKYQPQITYQYRSIFLVLISQTVYLFFTLTVYYGFERLCEWLKKDLNMFTVIKRNDTVHIMRQNFYGIDKETSGSSIISVSDSNYLTINQQEEVMNEF